MVIELEEVEVVKQIYREYLEGASLLQIGRGLETDGILTGGGKIVRQANLHSEGGGRKKKGFTAVNMWYLALLTTRNVVKFTVGLRGITEESVPQCGDAASTWNTDWKDAMR